jgi:hypothetical protein
MKEILLRLLPLILSAIILGSATVLAALIWLVIVERRSHGMVEKLGLGTDFAAGTERERHWSWLLLLGIFIAIGALLRVWGIDEKSISHPEIFIPGIPLPDGMSVPPPRLDLTRALSWHFYWEPHPVGYYLAMFAWVKALGYTLLSLRLPAALLGTLSIPVMYRIGCIAYDRATGLIAAGLLALHGFHIYWSQTARMYVPECFWGLVATWLFLATLYRPRPGRLIQIAYLLALLAGFYTEWYFWMLAASHGIVTLVHFKTGGEHRRRLLSIQLLAAVLGGLSLTQALATYRLAGPSGGFFKLGSLGAYLSFGYLFEPDTWSQPPRIFPAWFLVGGITLCVVLLAAGFRVRSRVFPVGQNNASLAIGPLRLASLGMAVLMAGLALPVARDAKGTVFITLFPLLAVAAFPFAERIGAYLTSRMEQWTSCTPALAQLTSPVAVLAVSPVAVVFLTLQRHLSALQNLPLQNGGFAGASDQGHEFLKCPQLVVLQSMFI